MGALDNINQGGIADLLRRVRALENRTTLNNSAIGRGGMEVYDGGVLNISNGGLNVVGSGTFTGTLYADGKITFTGDFTQSGPSTFTGKTGFVGDVTATGDFATNGPTHLNGPTETTGTLDVEGVTTLKNDLNVTDGGKITAGNTNITPSASNGGIEFTSGGGVGGNGGSVVVKGTGNAGLIASPTMTSIFSGASSVDVTAAAVTVNGPLKNPGMSTTASAANVFYDASSGQFFYKP
jgi:hypothetical protein